MGEAPLDPYAQLSQSEVTPVTPMTLKSFERHYKTDLKKGAAPEIRTLVYP